jgi:hypothetical protein
MRTDLAQQQVAHSTIHHFSCRLAPLRTDRRAWDVIHLCEQTWNNGVARCISCDNLRTSINARFENGTQIVIVESVDDDDDDDIGG